MVVMLALCTYTASAQLYDESKSLRSLDVFMAGAPIQEALNYQHKCALPFIMEIYARWDDLTELQQVEFSQQFGRPVTETNMISPKGYFRVHYDTSITSNHTPSLEGISGNGVPDYIDSVAAIFDHVFEFYTDVLGYGSPEAYGTFDPITVDTLRYDVYVRSLSNLGFSNLYGFTALYGTRIDDEDPVPRFRTFIVIDHGYQEFPTRGLDGLRVTAAHEFHHAIQIGAYASWISVSTDRPVRFFYEITSTWLEDVVYPEINDYYHYLPDLFRPSVYNFPFYSGFGLYMYARAIWGHMIERRYGRDIMRETWEYIRTKDPLDAIDRALRDHGATFQQELAEFYLWKFYTGTRAHPDKYFIDGADYPMLTEKSSAELFNEAMFRDVSVSSQTLHYHSLATGEADTVFLLIGNVDDNTNEEDNFYELRIYSRQRPNSIPVGNGLWYELISNDPSVWKVIPVYSERPVADGRVQHYPNPFNTGQASSVSFVVDTEEDVELTILTPNMRLVYRNVIRPEHAFGRPVVRWNGRDERNRQVASGVYVYLLNYGDTLQKGKITVIRE
jgi:hypothetical protein